MGESHLADRGSCTW